MMPLVFGVVCVMSNGWISIWKEKL